MRDHSHSVGVDTLWTARVVLAHDNWTHHSVDWITKSYNNRLYCLAATEKVSEQTHTGVSGGIGSFEQYVTGPQTLILLQL